MSGNDIINIDFVLKAMLGCPEEHREPDPLEPFGCTHGHAHPAGEAFMPPALIAAKGLTMWPQERPTLFDPSQESPGSKNHYSSLPMITFVYSLVSVHLSQGIDWQTKGDSIRKAMIHAARLHPHCL